MEKKQTFEKKSSLLFFFLKGCKKFFILSIICACLLALFEMVNPKIIRYTVDSVFGTEPSSLPAFVHAFVRADVLRDFLRSHLLIVALAVIVVALIAALFRYLYSFFIANGAEKLVKNMRDSLYEHILHLPYAWHGENKTGDIIQRCTSDVETVKRFLSEQLTSLFRIVVLIVFALYFMADINWVLMLCSFVFIPLIVLYSFIFHHKIGAAFQVVDEEEGKLSTIAQENLTGVRVVRAFGREKYERDRFEKQNKFYTNMWVKMMSLLSQFWAISDLISGAQILTVVTVGAVLVVKGYMTSGSYIAFIAYNAMLTWPVRNLGRVIADLSKAGISISRIQYIMNSKEEPERENAGDFPESASVQFKDVSFTYDNGVQKVLSHVNLEIKEGTTVGILGGTGSGKSTLMHLLDRMYELKDTEGEITVGGVDIRDIKAKELRKNIGLVLQEPYLFSRTLGENIKIGAEGATDADLQEASEIAALHSTIEKFTEGYNTPVGERGVTLSGGQKQRAAIAQMMIRKPKIMIFDDSLSAVDAETDSKIRKAIQEKTENSTVVLISHRITTLMHADYIYVLENGAVKEEGTHDALLSQNGIYKKIYDLQSSQK